MTDAKGRVDRFPPRHHRPDEQPRTRRTRRARCAAELLDRIDEIVVRRTRACREIERIVELQIAALADRMGAHAMHLEFTPRARAFLASESMAAGDGARYVARSISRYVATPLSGAILRGEILAGQTAQVAYDGKEITVNAA